MTAVIRILQLWPAALRVNAISVFCPPALKVRRDTSVPFEKSQLVWLTKGVTSPLVVHSFRRCHPSGTEAISGRAAFIGDRA